MATFKVKYNTRRKLQRAIERVIRDEGLIQDFALINSVRISAVTGDLNKVFITINAIYYYMFLDKGADLWNGGVIAPFNITKKAMESPQGKAFLDEVVQEYINFMQKEYELLDTGKIQIKEPRWFVNYNLYGDPEGRWNGIFE